MFGNKRDSSGFVRNLVTRANAKYRLSLVRSVADTFLVFAVVAEFRYTGEGFGLLPFWELVPV
jgi:hypothetical protein